MDNLSFFEKFLYEADESTPDVPPDIDMRADDTQAPIDEPIDQGPPDLEEPPTDDTDNISDDSFNDNQDDEFPEENSEDNNEENSNNMPLDQKVSAVMNVNLYQKYLSLLNTLGNQISMIQNNSDVLYTISEESIDVVNRLKQLDENIRLYIKHRFINENYSKNLLFFNKCLNLLKLLNGVFDRNIRKGIKDD